MTAGADADATGSFTSRGLKDFGAGRGTALTGLSAGGDAVFCAAEARERAFPAATSEVDFVVVICAALPLPGAALPSQI